MLPKLVRDKIPEIIKADGRDCKIHFANIPEYNLRLYDKIREELTEFMEDPSVEEAADIYEVFITLLRNWDIDLSDVIFKADDKREKRGGFRQGIILDEILD